jgi:beta-galactosidase
MIVRPPHKALAANRSLLLVAFCALLLSWQASLAADRQTLNFNPGWKFIKADPADAFKPDFKDDTWTNVSAPHTFNDTDTFDDWSVPGHVGETNQWVGRTWYRKSFTLPDSFKAKRVFLEFEAVRHVAEVYLNGQPLGINFTGFIPFGFDLSSLLRFGGATNVLAVMADNRFTLETELTRIAATELPWNSPHWHPAHGGIYRNVYLHVTDPLHITLPLYNSLKTVGPYVYSTDISEQSAQVHFEVPVLNERKTAESVEAQVEVLDREGKSVLVLKDTQPIVTGAQTTFNLAGRIAHPELWEPSYPYLYKAVFSLRANGQAIDQSDTPFGIRYVRWDTKTGFYINDHHVKLHGWGQKPTGEWPGLGAAYSDWMHYFTLELMKEAGGNWVRWGHCAGAPADLASTDELGLLVEQPGVDGEGDARGEAWKIRAAAFRDMIVYYRNHPSIVIWEGGNQRVTKEHAQELRSYMNTFDPHGGRAYTHRRADETTGEFMDVDIGTEGGRQVPRLPVIEGEYDREESPRRVWDDFSPPNFGYPEAKGQTYQLTSEQYAVDQVAEYVRKLGRPEHCGGANWIFSDTTSGGRVNCEVARDSGEVDGARLPKEAFYVCRAMWRDDPQVHIIGHWSYPAGTRKTVYVASNCGEVELLVNGRSLGRGKVSDRYLFAFPDVAWEKGELKALGFRHGAVVASQSKHTIGPAVAVRLTPILGPQGLQADGSDLALFDVEVVDAKGERCPTFQQRVDFALSGPAVWRGGYNSGKTNSINHQFLDVECGINRVAVRSTPVPGAITLSARCGDLQPATATVSSQCVMVDHGCAAGLPALPKPALPAKPNFLEQQTWSEPPADSPPGQFIKTFSYSGPTGVVCVQRDAKDGAKIFADRNFVFAGLPDLLRGGDWVQSANADKLFSAVDLMDFSVNADSVVYVAHDDRLPRPAWLQGQFKPTESSLAIDGRPLKLFQRQVRKGESLTLGSNTEDRRLKSCNMYLVFVNAPKAN